jgi:glycerophosphoryl diester phosphodiesterase
MSATGLRNTHTPGWRTDLYSQCAQPMTHKESVALFKQHGVKMTPELKQPEVTMPFNGQYSQQHYAQQLGNLLSPY